MILRMQEWEQIFYHLIVVTHWLWGILEREKVSPRARYYVKYYLENYQSALDQ